MATQALDQASLSAYALDDRYDAAEGRVLMTGEGVNWAASSMFTGKRHVFQNLGEGAYYHSGSMAIRQAIAARANIT